jgi:NAD-dependent dihydropyrimidine dehydrogenase PreA subunit
LKMTGELSPKGYDTVRVVDEGKCLGCGLCEVICPEFGIYLSTEDK